MQITSIQIVNTGVIECFDVALNGNNLEMSGGTGTGKTTAITALHDILSKRSDMLRHGEKKGTIAVTLSDGSKTIYAERRTTPSGSNVTLTAIDEKGKKTSITAADFKKMISDLSVNPHQIMNLKPKAQAETLLKSAKIDINLDETENRIESLSVNRLDLHRKAELLKVGDEPEKVDSVDITELIAKRDEMQVANTANQKKRDFLDGLVSQVDDHQEQINEAMDDIKSLNKELIEKEGELNAAKAKYTELDERIKTGNKTVAALVDENTDDITVQINNSQLTNEKALTHKNWLDQSNRHDDAVEAHRKADADVRELVEIKNKALESAAWPIPGLTIEEGNVIYNDCHLSNLGESEQMLVCAALAIEDIKAHPLKVVRMDGVESMSKDDFIKLQGLFNGEGIQVLSTRVSRNDVEPQEIVIVDGKYQA
jgi:hypothetical protein